MRVTSDLVGRTILHYRVLQKAGAGGMGEVYQAEDNELGRQVALKVLPLDLAEDPERVKRFKREARAIAALNHPNIVTIYAVEEVDGVHYLIMELVEGRSLDQLIADGGLPRAEFLPIALELADALVAAHEKGVAHRDLKPSNIMLTHDGRVKVIDFGLAKLLLPAGAHEGATRKATESLTSEGVMMGTVPYMSPEQLQGKSLDHRTDIFSLGVVLFEMATGRRPFVGASRADVVSAILRDSPLPLKQLKADLPRALDDVVRRCLEKDRGARFQSAADLRAALQHLSVSSSIYDTDEVDHMLADTATAAVATADPRADSLTVPILAGAALVLAVLGAAYFLLSSSSVVVNTGTRVVSGSAAASTSSGTFTRRSPPRQITYESVAQEWAVWSPDGTKLLYSAETAPGEVRHLYIRSLDSDEVEQVTGSERDDIQPLWSSNGHEIFFVRAKEPGQRVEITDVYTGWYSGEADLWKRDLAGRDDEEILIARDALNPALSPDGERLAYHALLGNSFRIWTCDVNGANAQPISSDTSEAIEHVEPSWSPDGTRIAFRRLENPNSKIFVLDLESRKQTAVTSDIHLDTQPVWSPTGKHIYFSSYRGSGINIWRISVNSAGEPTGLPEAVTFGAGHDIQAAFSRDGRKLTYTVLKLNSDIYRVPVDPQTGEQTGREEPVVATSREESRAAWSRNGEWIAFNSDRHDGNMNLWIRELQTGDERRVTDGPGGDYQPQWTPEGKQLVFFSGRAGNGDIWSVDIESGKLSQLTTAPTQDINPFISADGQHTAYQSDRNGRNEIWVMEIDGSNQRQLSKTGTGGHFNPWHPRKTAVCYTTWNTAGERVYNLAYVEDGREEEIWRREPRTGGHHSFSPDGTALMDLRDHVTIVNLTLSNGMSHDVFQFPDSRIDYPVWSPDGAWVTFDRFQQRGADIWMLDDVD